MEGKKIKDSISKFISHLSRNDYSKASKELSDAVNKKIEQKILNNNIKIF